MAALTSNERADLGLQIKQTLSSTRYACSSLDELGGGTTSFVFRGTLLKPLVREEGKEEERVIVKHATNFISCNKDFPLDASRSTYEALMLDALRFFTPSPAQLNQISVKTPAHYFFDKKTCVQILQYVPNAPTLKEVIPSISSKDTAIIGKTLGLWLRSLHDWTSAPEQSALREIVAGNKAMRDLKWKVTYQQGSDVLDQFPDIQGEEGKKLWEKLKGSMKEEIYQLSDGQGVNEEFGIMHGDFWTGNVLFQENASKGKHSTNLHIIDWEFAQFNHRCIDLGQFIGDLLEKAHFHPIGSPNHTNLVTLANGFLQGYGTVKEDMAFRILIHTGVHMINWWSRHGWAAPVERREKATEMLKVAWEIVKMGCLKDTEGLKRTTLSTLFS